MCDPLTIAGIALTLGSTAANYAANQRVEAARNDVLSAERIRQRGLDQEANALNLTSQDRYNDFTGQQDARGDTLAQFFNSQPIEEPTPAAAMPTSSSDLVVNEEAAQRAKAREFTDKTGTALGELRAFGDVLADTSRGQARDASLIGQIGGFKRGSSSVVPYELEKAGQSGDNLKLLGDLLGGFGTVGMTAGLSGGELPFFKSTIKPVLMPGIGSYTLAAKGVPRLGGIV